MAVSEIPRRRIRWRPCYRVVPSRFPPINLFERVADPADLEALFAVEAMTNARVRDEMGVLRLVAPEDRVTGPGAGYIMAPFTHLSAPGGRFNDGTFGAYYAAHTLATAIAETRFHRARFLAFTAEPPMHLDMRVLLARLDAELHDLRALRDAHPEWYDPDDYSAPQALARTLRAERSWGVAFQSVRHDGGECVAIWRPRALSDCRQGAHLAYVWNGREIVDVYEKRAFGGTTGGSGAADV